MMTAPDADRSRPGPAAPPALAGPGHPALAGPGHPAPPATIVIFGAAGDLTRRKLLPALYNLESNGLLPRELAIIGVTRRPKTHEAFREEQSRDILQFATRPVEARLWARLRDALYHHTGEFDDPATCRGLAALLAEVAQRHATGGNVLFYLAVPPAAFGPLVAHLGAAGLLRREAGGWRRVVVEKPYGRDLASAQELNAELATVLREDQIYRIDHYLGKETVQNILVFRFANTLFEPIWNRRYVDHVQITVAEAIGIEGRGGYYETAGALRDMIQNHMFQLLALVAMEPPSSFDADAVRDERVKVLHAIRPLLGEETLTRTVRGQYGAGLIDGQPVPAYRAEPRVSPASTVETYAALRLGVENWRWAGVPFYLRAGKRLPERRTEIIVEFRQPPLLLFERAAVSPFAPNRLLLHIQPQEGIELAIQAKRPGPIARIETVRLDFGYQDFGETVATTGYERLLYDCLMGDGTLFHRTDMVDAAWRLATPILEAWEAVPPRDFPNYAAGTWGPPAAEALLRADGRRWLRPAAPAPDDEGSVR